MSDNLAVTAADVASSYGDRQALCGVSFVVEAGASFGFLGPNGSGKSTLFKLLSTIVPQQAGAITMLGHDLGRDPAAIRRRIGVVFQSPAVDKKLTVHENLRYAGLLLNLGGKELSARIDEALGAAILTDRRGDAVEELSGGLRRRVEIAKCLMARPDLVLLDEASTGLDPAARREMWKVLRAQDGLTTAPGDPPDSPEGPQRAPSRPLRREIASLVDGVKTSAAASPADKGPEQESRSSEGAPRVASSGAGARAASDEAAAAREVPKGAGREGRGEERG